LSWCVPPITSVRGRTYVNNRNGEFRLQQQKEKVRIFALARALGWETIDLIGLCKKHGIDVKNQLSTVEPEVRDKIVDLVKRGVTTGATPAPAPPPPLTAPASRRVQTIHATRAPARTEPPRPAASAPAAAAPAT